VVVGRCERKLSMRLSRGARPAGRRDRPGRAPSARRAGRRRSRARRSPLAKPRSRPAPRAPSGAPTSLVEGGAELPRGDGLATRAPRQQRGLLDAAEDRRPLPLDAEAGRGEAEPRVEWPWPRSAAHDCDRAMELELTTAAWWRDCRVPAVFTLAPYSTVLLLRLRARRARRDVRTRQPQHGEREGAHVGPRGSRSTERTPARARGQRCERR